MTEINNNNNTLFIAAIGLSNEGFEALQIFFTHLPNGIKNISFVIVWNTTHENNGSLATLLANYTKMKVVEVEKAVPVNAGRIYITPPGYETIIKNAKLYLKKPSKKSVPLYPIDTFFTSLAEDQHAKAIGIVLTGTGTDGLLGMEAIKSAGGACIIQDPQSSKINSTLFTAMYSATVNAVLSPEKMGTQLLLIAGGKSGEVVGVNDSMVQSNRINAPVNNAAMPDEAISNSEMLQRQIEELPAEIRLMIENLEKSNRELVSQNVELKLQNNHLSQFNQQLETASKALMSDNNPIKVAKDQLGNSNMELSYTGDLLTKSEAHFNAMFLNTSQAFVLMDRSMQIIAYNEMAGQILNKIFSIKISNGKYFRELLSLKEFELFSADFEIVLKGKEVVAERSFVSKKGKMYSIISNFTPLMEGKKVCERILLNMMDITECKAMLSELNRSNRLIDSVFHIADIGIAVVDNSMRFIKVNDGLHKLLGLSQNELIGKQYHSIIPEEERTEILLQHQHFLKGNFKNMEGRLVCKDGKIVDCYITNSLLTDESGMVFFVKTFRDISEGKRYKELLQDAERNVSMGSYDFDVSTGKLIWTDEMYRLFGLDKTIFIPTVEIVIGMYEKDSANRIRKLVNEALISGKPFDTELQLIIPSGEKKWVRATGSVNKIKNKIVNLIGTVQDITRQKEQELELEKLSIVASKTNNAVIVMDTLGKTEWVNNCFTQMTGFAASEIIGKRPGEVLLVSETDKPIVERIVERLEKSLNSTEEIRSYKKDGTPFWVNLNISPVFKDGKLISYIAVAVDISELMAARETKRMTETLNRRQKLFSAIAKNFPDGIIGVLDKKLNYVFAGGTEIERLGIKPEHLIGEHIFDSLSNTNNADAEPFLKKAFEGENIIFETEVSGYAYSVNAVPLFWSNMGVDQILVVIYNITNRKNAENEVLQALAKQKELNELKSKFVSIASHEFRTPLSGILSSAYLIDKYSALNDVEKIHKHVERITGSVRTLTDIINDYLSLGRIEEGKVENMVSAFDVVEFCENLVDEIKPAIKKGQVIQYKHKGKGGRFLLDKRHLKNVLVNLLSNASKYSEEGKTIWLESSFENNRQQFVVKDEGIGIPNADQANLFQTFFRASNTSNIQGTGMGLHIVKKYLDVMGGSIYYSSRENEGSTFTISFPVEKQKEDVK